MNCLAVAKQVKDQKMFVNKLYNGEEEALLALEPAVYFWRTAKLS